MNRQNASRPLVRNRAGGARPLLSILPGGTPTSQLASLLGLSDSSGLPVACTRASPKYCRKSTVSDPSNLCPRPEQMHLSPWSGYSDIVAAPTITGNYGLAPDGSKTSTRVQFNAATTGQSNQLFQAISNLALGTYSFSVYVRGTGGAGSGTIYLMWQSAGVYAPVNYTGQWQRFSVTISGLSGGTNIKIGCDPLGISSPGISASDVEVWGAKVERLFVGDSNDLSSWSATAATVPSHATLAPDGTNTASVIKADAGSGFHGMNKTPTSGIDTSQTCTFSAYLKQGTARYATMWWSNTGGGVVYDLQAGAVLFASALQSGTITAAANGYWLVTQTGNSNLTSDAPLIEVYDGSQGVPPAGPATTWTAAGTETIFAWGVRLDQGAVRGGSYISPMLVQVGNNVPCLEPEGLLVEGSTTNIIVQSQDMSQASWTKNSCTATQNYGVAPDGSMTATRLVFSGAGNCHQAPALTGTVATASVWMRATSGSVSNVTLYVKNATNGFVVITQNTVTLTTQWQRVSASALSAIASGNLVDMDMTVGGACDIQVWGAQLEPQPFATSYVQTATVSVTRNGDVFSKSLPATFGSNSGRFVAVITPNFSGAPGIGADFMSFTPGPSAIMYEPGDTGVAGDIGGAYLKPGPVFSKGVPQKYTLDWTPTAATQSAFPAGNSGSSTFVSSATSAFTGLTWGAVTGSSRDPFWIHSIALYRR